MSKTTVNKVIFSERLKSLMDRNDETTYSIAEIVHLSAPTISRYLNAEMAPKITTVEVLAKHFGVNPAWLLGYDVPERIHRNEEPPQANDDDNPLAPLAAHFKGKKISPEKLKRIEKFIEFTLNEED